MKFFLLTTLLSLNVLALEIEIPKIRVDREIKNIAEITQVGVQTRLVSASRGPNPNWPKKAYRSCYKSGGLFSGGLYGESTPYASTINLKVTIKSNNIIEIENYEQFANGHFADMTHFFRTDLARKNAFEYCGVRAHVYIVLSGKDEDGVPFFTEFNFEDERNMGNGLEVSDGNPECWQEFSMDGLNQLNCVTKTSPVLESLYSDNINSYSRMIGPISYQNWSGPRH